MKRYSGDDNDTVAEQNGQTRTARIEVLGRRPHLLNLGRTEYDLSTVSSKPALRNLLQVLYPGRKERNIAWSMGQIWAWVREMKPGDWVAVPSKMKAAIHNSEITGPYVFEPERRRPLLPLSHC